MARPRQPKPAESAYERRIRRYLEAHPGATRQEARGHRLRPGERSEYQRRVQGARGPEERAQRAGHRGYRDLLRGLRDGDLVSVDPGSVRDEQGRWKVVRVTVLDQDGRERVYTIRGVTDEKIRALTGRMGAVGAISSPAYPPGRLMRDAA